MRKSLEQTAISEQVMELGKKCGELLQSQPRQSEAETDAAKKGIVADVGRLECCISVIADWQQTTLLNVVPFDARKVLQTLGYVKSDMMLLGDCDEAIKAVDSMICRVREIEAVIQKIEGCGETQIGLYQKMMDDYRVSQWAHDYLVFVQRVRDDVREEVKSGKSAIDVLKSKLVSMRQKRLDSYMPAHVRRLYDSVVTADCPTYEAIVRGRQELTDDDITDFFSFLYRYSLLKHHIESVSFLKPVVGDYDKLFTSWAAKKYVTLLSPALMVYGGIQEKGHFAVLLMVMRDLGLSPKENTPYLQMKNYANEINKVDDILQFGNDHTIFSKTFKLLGETPFCELEYGAVGDSKFEVEKLKEYQEVYHRCLTILNYFGLRRPEEMKSAAYLKEPNPTIDILSDYMGLYSDEVRTRLNFLCSVLRRETLVFG